MTTARTALPTGAWTLDTARSTAAFTVRNGPATVHGTVPVSAGSVRVDAATVAVEVDLDLSAITTGNPRRDRDLRKPALLDLDQHPRMRFVATRVREGDDGWALVGTLSVRGRDVPVALEVAEMHAVPGSAVIGTTRLDRRDLGVRAPRIMIGRWIDVTVRAVLVQ